LPLTHTFRYIVSSGEGRIKFVDAPLSEHALRRSQNLKAIGGCATFSIWNENRS
jgi:hypothetical protein